MIEEPEGLFQPPLLIPTLIIIISSKSGTIESSLLWKCTNGDKNAIFLGLI